MFTFCKGGFSQNGRIKHCYVPHQIMTGALLSEWVILFSQLKEMLLRCPCACNANWSRNSRAAHLSKQTDAHHLYYRSESLLHVQIHWRKDKMIFCFCFPQFKQHIKHAATLTRYSNSVEFTWHPWRKASQVYIWLLKYIHRSPSPCYWLCECGPNYRHKKKVDRNKEAGKSKWHGGNKG